MKPLSPNGDIVRRQGSDPLTVASREGIYELARGIALRMAWNKPDAYEKARQGDWSFVGWDSTPFATRYKIPWSKSDESGPLMFGAVRSLIDEWYRNFLKKSERYAAWRKYFSLTCNYTEFDNFGDFPVIGGGGGDVGTVVPGCIGFPGGENEPFLKGRGDLQVNCGRSEILSAFTMVGFEFDPSDYLVRNLEEIATVNFDGYDKNLGADSYSRFKANTLALEDDWEMGMAALIGMFNRCYWAMETVDGELAHPPLKVVFEDLFFQAQISVTYEVVDGDSPYIEITPKFEREETSRNDPTAFVGETETLVLQRQSGITTGYVNGTIRYSYAAAPEVIDVSSGEATQTNSVYVNEAYYGVVYWMRRNGTAAMGDPPTITNPTCSVSRVKSVEIDERFASVEDHVSEKTWIFERIDSDKDAGYHQGEMKPEVVDKTLKEAFGEYLRKMKDTPGVVADTFEQWSVSLDTSEMKPFRLRLEAEPIIDIYDANGRYIGTNGEAYDIRPWGHYSAANDPSAHTRSESYGRPVGAYYAAGGTSYDGGFRVDVKMAVVGRSDIPL